MRPRVRALLALISHTMRTAELNRAYLAEEGDPAASTHLYAAVMAMRVAERPDGIVLLRQKADELDPPD
ncbi:hypothetical protein Lesp02_31970 [Lentzea sp. NBRC 105346]|uniref:hypothetical protein n=1 Tax=Lentzea sp. NBRC 105346 TaxID=3032205 RepID=UPI0024A0750E|nr:hypothetical protein [Lentzea sp. NBRC 105346]GLZ31008.1 hypothetical protein Lesp02_31970 [Lentzea sp. NBRC 105346]